MRPHIPKEELELLSKVPLFSACTDVELREIAGLGTQLDFPAGRALTTEGMPGNEFFLLLEGEVECDVRGVTVAVLGPGDYFGELALLDGGPRTATVSGVTPIRVLVLSANEFATLLRASPTIGTKLLSHLAGRLRDAEASMIH